MPVTKEYPHQIEDASCRSYTSQVGADMGAKMWAATRPEWNGSRAAVFFFFWTVRAAVMSPLFVAMYYLLPLCFTRAVCSAYVLESVLQLIVLASFHTHEWENISVRIHDRSSIYSTQIKDGKVKISEHINDVQSVYINIWTQECLWRIKRHFKLGRSRDNILIIQAKGIPA
jgi:hypothetical protein